MYQGKVAIYHAVKLLIEGVDVGNHDDCFDVALDSTDDFAIYRSTKAVSLHQVKAKNSKYRSTYANALEKASRNNTDCDGNTQRYFHIAIDIDNADDYLNSAGVKVSFYDYDEKKYCPIEDIEKKTCDQIKKYLNMLGLCSTPILIDKKYCHLSELASSHVIKIHGLIHAGQSQNDAAYNNRINSKALVEILHTDYNSNADEEYVLLKLKSTFADAFERYVAAEETQLSDIQIDRTKLAFDFIYSLEKTSVKKVLDSLLPTSSDNHIRLEDVQNYADIITNITCALTLRDIPHYANREHKYLPTALHLLENRIPFFRKELLRQIRGNANLSHILYEFNKLIVGGNASNISVRCEYEKITELSDSSDKNDNNITKEFTVSVVSRQTAEGELNA